MDEDVGLIENLIAASGNFRSATDGPGTGNPYGLFGRSNVCGGLKRAQKYEPFGDWMKEFLEQHAGGAPDPLSYL